MNPRILAWLCTGAAVLPGLAWAQETAPTMIKLEDALTRARQYGGLIQTANFAALLAREDRAQVRAASLPSASAFNQFIYTEGNGTPAGVFVANDGVHIYNEQAVVHEELLAYLRQGEIRRALAAEAVARARIDVASRGLSVTVVQDYYAIVVAQRRYANAQAILVESQRFLDVTQKLEQGGEASHSDVVKAQIDVQQRQRDVREALLAVEKAKITLGVLIFPNFGANFSAVDDLQQLALLPPRTEVQAQAVVTSPDLTAARAGVQQAGYDVSVARYGYLPSLGLDLFYGINANQFAARTHYPPEAGQDVPYRQNLGYALQATLNIPVWNWGATRSKVKQAEFRREQARLDLTLVQRGLDGTLAALYAEAQAVQGQLESLRSSVDLAVESLRLTVLRYQAGEATALEVVDAQNTLTLSRNANDDGLSRYRVALANLQILAGNL